MNRGNLRRRIVVGLGLLAMVLAVFGAVGSHRFVAYDDDKYVTKNFQVRDGVSAAGVRWAFTAFRASNWHPLTWISHMLDVQLFGLDPRGHHLVSLLLHGANTVLLFLVLTALTGALWRSALVAALFGVHPLHVESVAWAAERKDVLSGLFFFLTLGAYLAYLRRPGVGRYAVAVLCFALGLLAKPMLVTLPFVLLLLDVWPLRRTVPPGSRAVSLRAQARVLFTKLLAEKVPFFLLAAASCGMTYHAQRAGGALLSADLFPFQDRAANALLSYAAYIGKTFWPARLTFFYPLREQWSGLLLAGAGLLGAALCLLILAQARRRPWLAVGWLWFCGMLVPVIGLIQVGLQSMADRYTYLPLIGIFLVVAWGLGEAAATSGGRGAPVMAIAASALLLALGVAARVQVGYWRNGESLFRHGVEADPGNYVAMKNLALEMLQQGREEEANALVQEAIRVKPSDAKAWIDLGYLQGRRGDYTAALASIGKALALAPQSVEARNNLGVVLAQLGRLDEAYPQFLAALRLRPDCAETYRNLGAWFDRKGEIEASLANFRKALAYDPDMVEASYGVGIQLLRLGRLEEAQRHLGEAQRLRR